MNSTLQCLYSVPELKEALAAYRAPGHSEYDGPHKLTVATRDLFAEIARSGDAVTPLRFLATLRQIFPQFASQAPNGAYMQQDAEECWTGIMETLRQRLQGGGAGASAAGAGAPSASPVVKELFGIDLQTRLRSEETGEERVAAKTEYTFKCNITTAVTHLMQGFRLALDETREANSEVAGRSVVFTGTSSLTRLPLYLTVQLMRFDYRKDTRERCKIMKEVAFSTTQDVYEFCTDEVKAALDEPRRRVRFCLHLPAVSAAFADAHSPLRARPRQHRKKRRPTRRWVSGCSRRQPAAAAALPLLLLLLLLLRRPRPLAMRSWRTRTGRPPPLRRRLPPCPRRRASTSCARWSRTRAALPTAGTTYRT